MFYLPETPDQNRHDLVFTLNLKARFGIAAEFEGKQLDTFFDRIGYRVSIVLTDRI
jgi:hypothetical protein